MIAGVDEAEVAKYREMLRDGGTLPSLKVSKLASEPRPKPQKENRGAAGRFQTLNDFVDISARLVDTTAQAVWLVLFRETKPKGVACVSHSQIAMQIGTSRRTVVRAVQKLEKAKLVVVVRRGGLSGGTSVYRVNGTTPSE